MDVTAVTVEIVLTVVTGVTNVTDEIAVMDVIAMTDEAVVDSCDK